MFWDNNCVVFKQLFSKINSANSLESKILISVYNILNFFVTTINVLHFGHYELGWPYQDSLCDIVYSLVIL